MLSPRWRSGEERGGSVGASFIRGAGGREGERRMTDEVIKVPLPGTVVEFTNLRAAQTCMKGKRGTVTKAGASDFLVEMEGGLLVRVPNALARRVLPISAVAVKQGVQSKANTREKRLEDARDFYYRQANLRSHAHLATTTRP